MLGRPASDCAAGKVEAGKVERRSRGTRKGVGNDGGVELECHTVDIVLKS